MSFLFRCVHLSMARNRERNFTQTTFVLHPKEDDLHLLHEKHQKFIFKKELLGKVCNLKFLIRSEECFTENKLEKDVFSFLT